MVLFLNIWKNKCDSVTALSCFAVLSVAQLDANKIGFKIFESDRLILKNDGDKSCVVQSVFSCWCSRSVFEFNHYSHSSKLFIGTFFNSTFTKPCIKREQKCMMLDPLKAKLNIVFLLFPEVCAQFCLSKLFSIFSYTFAFVSERLLSFHFALCDFFISKKNWFLSIMLFQCWVP